MAAFIYSIVITLVLLAVLLYDTRLVRQLKAEIVKLRGIVARYEPVIQKAAMAAFRPEPEPTPEPEPEITEDEAFNELLEILKSNGYEIAFTIPAAEAIPEPAPEAENCQPETAQETAPAVSQKEKTTRKPRKKGKGK